MGIRLVVRSTWRRQSSPTDDAIFEFEQPKITVGRGSSCDVRLPHSAVSTLHASVVVKGAGFSVVDEGSTNGTRVNNQSVPAGRPKSLRSGDLIDMGGFVLKVELGVPVAHATSVDRTFAFARRLLRDAEDELPPPSLMVLNGPQSGERLEIPQPPASLVIGRSEDCDLVLVDGDASREHVELAIDFDGTLAIDLGSKNPLQVNDREVHERRLKDRDQLRIGSTLLEYDDPADASLESLREEEDQAVEVPEIDPRSLMPATREAKRSDLVVEVNASVDPALDSTVLAERVQPKANDDGGDGGDGGDGNEEADLERTDDVERLPSLSDAPAPATKATRSGGPNADLVIYLLAAIILALSIGGLVYLFRG